MNRPLTIKDLVYFLNEYGELDDPKKATYATDDQVDTIFLNMGLLYIADHLYEEWYNVPKTHHFYRLTFKGLWIYYCIENKMINPKIYFRHRNKKI